jgi:peptidoglycan hydrolase CwlO-like protein
MESLKKEVRMQKKEFDKAIYNKNTKINDLLTELENSKTDLKYYNDKVDSLTKRQTNHDTDIDNLHQTYN